MLGRYHRDMGPLQERRGQQLINPADGFGCNGEVRLAIQDRADHLLWVALTQCDCDPRMIAPELCDHVWQRVAGLGVGSRDGQGASFAVGPLPAHPMKVFEIIEDPFGDR